MKAAAWEQLSRRRYLKVAERRSHLLVLFQRDLRLLPLITQGAAWVHGLCFNAKSTGYLMLKHLSRHGLGVGSRSVSQRPTLHCFHQPVDNPFTCFQGQLRIPGLSCLRVFTMNDRGSLSRFADE